jgi:hypothetical protein
VNTVLKDGVVSIGVNPAKSAYTVTGSVQDAGDEPGRVGSAHLHPAAGEKTVEFNYFGESVKNYIHGGSPSREDYAEHTRAYKMGTAKNGVRSIAVDEKNIYLWASLKTHNILSFGEEYKGEVNKKNRFLEMPLYNSASSQTIIISRPK